MMYKSYEERLVLIKRCSDPHLWYAPYVGMYWEVIGEEEDIYWAKEPAGYKNILYREDVELMERND